MFSLMESMPEHEFIPFCVDFEKNEETPYSRFFLEAPGGRNNVYFSDFQMSWLKKLSFSAELIYSFKAKNKLSAMIAEVKPDVALFLNGVHFSDSIIDACHKHNVPILWRMSDFHKICANYLLFRDGKICRECLESGISRVLWNRCGGYQRSLAVSLIKYAGMKLSRLRNIYKHIDYYVVPSLFTREKLIQGGFPPDRIVHIPTFIDMPETFSNSTVEAKDILYVGRFSPEKGVNILVEAFSKIKNKSARLLLAGGTKEEYEAVMGDTLPASLEGKVKFLGFLSLNKVYELFASCAFFVVPSIWYENQPNSVLEGMRFGKPALVSKLGSLQEMVVEGDTGFLFEPGNSDDLADKMDHLLADPESMGRIGQNAFNYVKKYHSKEDHLARLNELFLKCTENSKI